jgi:steroid 5-alpha reductase family enzyme
MLLTILLLIFTLIIVPLVCFNFGVSPTGLQWTILYQMTYILSGVIAYCFVIGELAKNNSQVDKLWSIVPIYYVWHMTALGSWDPRMILMSVLVSLWGIRLTFNFARRGAYSWRFWSGEEDYRWEVLRKRKGFNNPIIWMLFNLFFICTYQLTLIFLFTLPILVCLNTNVDHNLNWIDGVLALLMISCIYIEFIADNQQYAFQQEKHRRIANGEALGEYKKGFVSSGLWGIVRHPNYSMEQTIWLIFYLFSVHITGSWINWSIAGCILLIILFKGSSDFSEEISAEKYPEYKEYQKSVPRFIPFLKNRRKSKDLI